LKKVIGEEVEEGSRRMRRTRNQEDECDGRERNAVLMSSRLLRGHSFTFSYERCSRSMRLI
jgi:hypothetical protein